MNVKKIFLILTLFSFLLVGASGLILFFSFQDDVFRKVLGFNKSSWLSYHMAFAIVNIILVSYHVGSRWTWVEKYMIEFNKTKVSKNINYKRYSNFSIMLVFSISLLSGFLSWILSGECKICLEIHKYTGFFLWLSFIYHLFLHRKSFY